MAIYTHKTLKLYIPSSLRDFHQFSYMGNNDSASSWTSVSNLNYADPNSGLNKQGIDPSKLVDRTVDIYAYPKTSKLYGYVLVIIENE